MLRKFDSLPHWTFLALSSVVLAACQPSSAAEPAQKPDVVKPPAATKPEPKPDAKLLAAGNACVHAHDKGLAPSTDPGGPPVVYGRPRFEGVYGSTGLAHFDLRIVESQTPYVVDSIDVLWATHDSGVPPVYPSPPVPLHIASPNGPAPDWSAGCIDIEYPPAGQLLRVSVTFKRKTGVAIATHTMDWPIPQTPVPNWDLFNDPP